MTHYVYTRLDAQRRPLYVGCTNDVRRRIAEHRARTSWASSVATVLVLEFASRDAALIEESRRIGKYRPLHNVASNPRFTTVRTAQAEADAWTRYCESNSWDEVAVA